MAGEAHSPCPALLETVAKFPTASWRRARACSAPGRGQLLMSALVRLQPGRQRAPAPAGFLSGASEPVSAGPRHLGRGAQRPGEARPSPQRSTQPAASSMDSSPQEAGELGTDRGQDGRALGPAGGRSPAR
uniref:Uncharacterized protein n=1 Tax=Neovison vison TaxID=452646 RepID=A0A8C7BVF5_NEOVI